MKFSDIKAIDYGSYKCDVPWEMVTRKLAEDQNEVKLDLDPDYQRGHVWTPEQKTKYVEWGLRGGRSGMDVYFNWVGYHDDQRGPYELVDGKQRLSAITGFFANEVRAFGLLYREFDGRFRTGCCPHVHWHIMELPTRADVLRWYLMFNGGGVVHSKEELARVSRLLKKEEKQ